MKIVTSKAYQKWAKANRGNAEMAVEKFLFRVFNSPDIANVTPQPKSVGNNLRKDTGVVDEFSLNRYRIYSKCIEIEPGCPVFYLAMVGTKGITNQNDDILKALAIFDDITSTEWDNWQPSQEQIQLLPEQKSEVNNDVPSSTGTSVASEPKKASKKKGKPVDENGLTVAERKALRKKEQEEERKRKKEQQESKKRKQEEEKKSRDAATQDEQIKVAPEIADADKGSSAASDVQSVIPEATTDKNDLENPVVVLNGEPVSTPVRLTGDETFRDITHVQYELELIEHQINIEKLQIEIGRQNIIMAQHEIALEELAIKKLKLLQMQKTQNVQK